jgi:hypothetical protein
MNSGYKLVIIILISNLQFINKFKICLDRNIEDKILFMIAIHHQHEI